MNAVADFPLAALCFVSIAVRYAMPGSLVAAAVLWVVR